MSSNNSFGFKAPEASPGFLLWQTTVVWQKMIKSALKPYGISHAQFVILAVTLWLSEHNIIPNQTLLADKTKLDKMTVSAALKQLRDKGLVYRQEHNKDLRAKTITLTQKGKVLTQKLVSSVERVDKQFFHANVHYDAIQLFQQLIASTDNK
jgi:DNA-binding MarR family transcriptional regulator